MLKIFKPEIKPEDFFKDLPQLETPRLKLRKLSMRDSNDIFEYACDREVAKYVSWDFHRSVADSIHFIRIILHNYSVGEPSPWGIVYTELNKLIGTIGFHNRSVEHKRAEIGYALSSAFWNRGIMTEALREVIRFGFEAMELNRIEAKCVDENSASERVMIKCGMAYEGTLREYHRKNELFQNLKIYSILRNQYLLI
jgi:ribosomal-protein-alanine N-acetyltransferase